MKIIGGGMTHGWNDRLQLLHTAECEAYRTGLSPDILRSNFIGNLSRLVSKSAWNRAVSDALDFAKEVEDKARLSNKAAIKKSGSKEPKS